MPASLPVASVPAPSAYVVSKWTMEKVSNGRVSTEQPAAADSWYGKRGEAECAASGKTSGCARFSLRRPESGVGRGDVFRTAGRTPASQPYTHGCAIYLLRQRWISAASGVPLRAMAAGLWGCVPARCVAPDWLAMESGAPPVRTRPYQPVVCRRLGQEVARRRQRSWADGARRRQRSWTDGARRRLQRRRLGTRRRRGWPRADSLFFCVAIL